MGSNAGTLRFAVRVRVVDPSMKFDPADVRTFQATVSQLAIAQAQEFASMKRPTQPSTPFVGPSGFRLQTVGREQWVAYERNAGTQIFALPLDSTHYIEVIFSYMSNGTSDSWRGVATSDAKKILSTAFFVRR
jgi:hypothetical protein